MRAVVGMQLPATDKRSTSDSRLLEDEAAGIVGSKVRQLLIDMDTDKHSVIFTQSKAFIHHLGQVFNDKDIGHKSLYLGQDTSESQASVAEWIKVDRSGTPEFPVLLVQAGAAARHGGG